jgi:hypothetical protein
MNGSSVEINAMWKLSGDDIQKAKEQLQEQRAALQAHYDSEVSRLDGELADIERVERFAVNFASNHRDETPSIAAVDPVVAPAPMEQEAAPPAEAASEHSPFEKSADSETMPGGEPVRTEGKGSRWRMRLGNVSETEAA